MQEFHTAVERYFLNSHIGVAGRARRQRDDSSQAAQDAKRNIYRALRAVNSIVHSSGINPEIFYQQPPIVGGREYNINIITNIFRLDELQIPVDMPDGFVQQAIGVYTDDNGAAWRRTLNPFWWLGRILSWFAHIPFELIGKAGFDAGKAEGSFIGKVASLILYLIPIIAGLLAILDRMDYLGAFKDYWK